MAIDFPNSPVLNQVFNASNGSVYTWNGTVWVPVGVAGSQIALADTPPSSPNPGQLWWNSILGQLMIWFNDGTSSQWVPASPVPMLGGGTGEVTVVDAVTGNGLPINVDSVLPFASVRSGNAGGWWNTSTYRYTPPAGKYLISCYYAALLSSGASSTVFLKLRKNGAVINVAAPQSGSPNFLIGSTLVAYVDASGTDYFDVVLNPNANGGVTNGGTFTAIPLTGMQGPMGPAGPSSGLQQTVFVEPGTWTTATALMSASLPVITEGTEFMNCAITPRSATSRLIIEVTYMGGNSIVAGYTIALFRDAVTNALAAIGGYTSATNGATFNTSFRHVMTAGTTSPITFRVRAGLTSAGTISFNGSPGGQYFGGVAASSVVIQEVLP